MIMKKLFKRYTKPFVAVILSVSLVFSNAASVPVQAAALPVVYSAFDLWVTVLSLLGICAAAENLDNVDQAVEDIKSKFKVVYQDNHKDEEPDEEKWNTFLDLSRYVDSNNNLKIPQSVWEEYKKFGDAITKKPNYLANSDSINMNAMTQEEFRNWLRNYIGLDEYNQNSEVNSFCNQAYSRFQEYNFNGIITGPAPDESSRFLAYPITSFDTKKYGLYEQTGSNPNNWYYFGYSSGGIGLGDPTHLYWNSSKNNFYCNKNDSSYSRLAIATRPVIAFFVNGYMYDFDAIFQPPSNLTSSIEWGNLLSEEDFKIPSNTISNALSSVTQSAANSLNIADVFDNGTYDIITPGRNLDPDTGAVTGDVVVPLPAPETIGQFSDGTITWAQMLEILNAQAVDTSTSKDLNTEEIIKTQNGILGVLNDIWNFLQSLIDALINMLLSLFVPSEGFFEEWFSSLNDFFSDRLGFFYKPFDVLFTLLNTMLNYDPEKSLLYFPGIYWQEYEICPPTYVDLDISSKFPKLTTYMHLGTNLVMIFAFLMLVQRKFEEAIKR